MQNVKYEHLTDLQRRALDEADQVSKNAYNPYSHFYVGACLVSADGQLISGANFENAAYGSTICAERSAVLRANAMGVRRFRSIAIITRGENFETTEVTGPCGSCRQVLYEISQISGYDLQVVLSTTKKDKIVVATIGELLPLAFGPIDLGIEISKY
ncbi:MAG: cytidine deaminase [Candidatus Sungiibacteriota bacterium]|uniref:Cytidine deaminase n=1 Tax=Candidatus Sungiibacteriota bacterium TaxID=2750080 RepID=A0A7T5UR17_9BACT|nr:MAG: cytidine deaminase [Candidatus Sungbacteria bacterium]